jgi:diketogulonate reductase-like aldo/keto reductase
MIGLGTFGSDHADPIEVACAVRGAYEVGYRHFDCAAVYGNEPEIGRVSRELFCTGVQRDDLWVTSKVWNDMHGRIEEACRQSLADLQLPYLHEDLAADVAPGRTRADTAHRDIEHDHPEAPPAAGRCSY